MYEHDSISGAPCPSGFAKISRVAHCIPEQLKCKQCGSYHKEVMDDYLRNEIALREETESAEVKQLAAQLIEQIAENEPDLSIGQARYLSIALAEWAFKKGCRP